ncbi:MAG: nitroreductase, partial [Methyloligellaceae bacterium]
MSESALKLLLERRSVVANKLGEPGPDEDQLRGILSAAARVPDHKRLVPWRFILFQGDARAAFGEVLADACKDAEPDARDARLELEAGRFLRAPVVVAVISRIVDSPVVPEWEQILSAGAACQNLLTAANASGFSGQWITEWYAYDKQVCAALGL